MSERHLETYIGDAVYVYMTDWGDVVLYTGDGQNMQIVLEHSVLARFDEWRAAITKYVSEIRAQQEALAKLKIGDSDD